MQHAVMGAAEAVIGQDTVGIADEVAIGEEEQLDEVEGHGQSRGRDGRCLRHDRFRAGQALGQRSSPKI